MSDPSQPTYTVGVAVNGLKDGVQLAIAATHLDKARSIFDSSVFLEAHKPTPGSKSSLPGDSSDASTDRTEEPTRMGLIVQSLWDQFGNATHPQDWLPFCESLRNAKIESIAGTPLFTCDASYESAFEPTRPEYVVDLTDRSETAITLAAIAKRALGQATCF